MYIYIHTHKLRGREREGNKKYQQTRRERDTEKDISSEKRECVCLCLCVPEHERIGGMEEGRTGPSERTMGWEGGKNRGQSRVGMWCRAVGGRGGTSGFSSQSKAEDRVDRHV